MKRIMLALCMLSTSMKTYCSSYKKPVSSNYPPIPTLHELAFNKLKPLLINKIENKRYPEFAEHVATYAPKLFPSFIETHTNFNGETLLTNAAQCNRAVKVERLIALGINVNQVSRDGQSALHIATQKGSKKIIPLLLAAGADVNQEQQKNDRLSQLGSGATPLFYSNTKATSLYLLSAGANPQHVDHAGNNALHYAAKNNRVNPDVIKVLANAGTDINSKNHKGETPLHTIIDKMLFRDGEKMITLIEAGADITIQDNFGRTPSMLINDQMYIDRTGTWRQFHNAVEQQALKKIQAERRNSEDHKITKKIKLNN